MAEKRLILAIKILIFASFIMPLIVMGQGYVFPFVFPKAIYFRILVEIMLAFYIILCVINKDYLPKRTLVSLAVLFWAIALFLASIFGTDFIRSFWGNFERMSGWYTLAHFAIYFLIVSSVLREWRDWKWLLRVSLLFALIVGCTGINFFVPANSILRMGGGGSLGNQIYIANFILFHVLIAWYLFRKESNKFWKGYAVVFGLLGIILMSGNGKRGPFLGLVGGVVFGALLYSLLSRSKKWKIVGASFLIILILGSVGIFLGRKSAFVRDIPVLGNIANTSLSSGTAATRLIAWEIAFKAWQERPVFGWGPENFYYAFDKYYNPRSLEFGYYETWFDRSHNIFLDYLSTSGAIGFLAYLSLFGAIGWSVWTALKKKIIDLDGFVFVAVFFAASAIQNFFVFDHLSSYLVFFLILAFANFLILPKDISVEIGETHSNFSYRRKKEFRGCVLIEAPRGLPVGTSIVVGLITIIVIYQTNINQAKANNFDFESQKALQTSIIGSVEKVKQALDASQVNAVDIRLDFSRAILSLAGYSQAKDSVDYMKAVAFAMEQLKEIEKDHQYEIQAPLLLAQYYAVLGQLDESQVYFSKALKLSPDRQQIIFMWVRLKLAMQDVDGALRLLNKTRVDNPKIAETYWFLALAWQQKGDNAQAADNLKQSLNLGRVFTDKNEMHYALSVLGAGKNWVDLKNVGEMFLKSNPDDSKIILDLAEAYRNLGDKNKVKELIDRAATIDKQTTGTSKTLLK